MDGAGAVSGGATGGGASESDPAAAPRLDVRWVAQLTGPSNEDEIDGVAAAEDGSVYVTGKFERSTVLGGRELRSAGAADIPVARFDRDGEPQWVVRFGGTGEDNLFDIAARPGGAVATGWFEGTVRFGGTTLTSTGSSDCVVVDLDDGGAVQWARSFGGPGADGCNEVVVGDDGSVVTSMDTQGGWTSSGVDVAPDPRADSVVLRLAADGSTEWIRHVGGAGRQRAKAVAVTPDGSVVVGGDTVGGLEIEGRVTPVPGRSGDAWMARWTTTGDLEWVRSWGGPGDDLVKGISADAASVYAVGTFADSVDVAGVVLDAGDGMDLAVARFAPDGSLHWATSVTADEPLAGAEVVSTDDGGVLFGSGLVRGVVLRSRSGTRTEVDASPGGTAWLASYGPDGAVGFATTIAGTAGGGPDEIARVGERVYVDIVVRGSDTVGAGTRIEADGKDGSLWALDVPGS